MVKDISAKDAFAALQSNPTAVLLDVRTQPELAFSGAPSMANHRHISLTQFPPTEPNPNFMAEVEAQIAKDQPVYCLCKTGRSAAAANALVATGYAASL